MRKALLGICLLSALSWIGCDCGAERAPGKLDAGARDSSVLPDVLTDTLLLDTTAVDQAAPVDAADTDAALADAASADAWTVDASADDASTDDATTDDATAGDAVVFDVGGVDGAVEDVYLPDTQMPDAVHDGRVEDAGTPVAVNVSIKVDELGTSQVQDVRFGFVRLDWNAFGSRPVCEDGGMGDAAGNDGGQPFVDFVTDSLGTPAVLNSVGTSTQQFNMEVPQDPPQSHLTYLPEDPCGLSDTTKMALYMPVAFLEGAAGTPGEFDDNDDIIGTGETVSYANGNGQGTHMLAYVVGDSPPYSLSQGWNLVIMGLYDNAPAPDVLDLSSDVVAASITATPQETLEVSGVLTEPDGSPVAADETRRVGFMVFPASGGGEEVDITGNDPVSVGASGSTYQGLVLPAELGTVSRYLSRMGPMLLAHGTIFAYQDNDGDGRYRPGFGDTPVASANHSCPYRAILYFKDPIPWPMVLFTRAKMARGYNIVGQGWDEDELQVSLFTNIPATQTIDLDMPEDPDHAYTDNDEPTADTGCACGVIPAPYSSGCQ